LPGFWSPLNFPYPPGLKFTTTNRAQRIEEFLANYARTVRQYAKQIAKHTARRVWDDKHQCYKTGGPIFIYRTTFRFDCQGSHWAMVTRSWQKVRMSVAPCNETIALIDRMNAILFPEFEKAGVLILNTESLFRNTSVCPLHDGVHPDLRCHEKLNSLVVNFIAAAMRQKNKCVCTTPLYL